MQQVRGCMVASRTVAAVHIDLRARELAHTHGTLLDTARVHNAARAIHLRILDHEEATGGTDPASVADLTTAFGVKRRRLEDQPRGGTRGELLPGPAIASSGQDACFGLCLGPCQEFSRRLIAKFVARGVLGALKSCGAACAVALGAERPVILGAVESNSLLTQNFLGELYGEAICLVEIEDALT